jgi:hypothetical protein
VKLKLKKLKDEQIKEFVSRKETLGIINCLEKEINFFKLFAKT